MAEPASNWRPKRVRAAAPKESTIERVGERYVYVYGGRYIMRRHAVSAIAKVAFPDMSERDARKLVSSALTTATKNRDIPKSRSYEVEVLFQWASGKWPELGKVDRLPRARREQTGAEEDPIRVGDLAAADVIIGYKTHEECLRAYRRAERARLQLAEEVTRLQQRLREMEQTLFEFRQKDNDRRRKASEAGRKGGAGRHSR